jgi:hypothetical protein
VQRVQLDVADLQTSIKHELGSLRQAMLASVGGGLYTPLSGGEMSNPGIAPPPGLM